MSEGDPSNGWDAVAEQFAEWRSSIGAATVQQWAQQLPASATVLDVGCGTGVPITDALCRMGHSVYVLDPSPRMLERLQQRLPHVTVACEAIESSSCFGRTFDGIVAVGVLFLLAPHNQERALQRMASALSPTGRLLFSAPRDACTWTDTLTGYKSVSLGLSAYCDLLRDYGMALSNSYTDDGDNHYFAATFA